MTAQPVEQPGPAPAAWRAHRSGVAHVDELLAVLAVEQVDELTWAGGSVIWPHGRIYGGQILAQSAVAAGQTADPSAVAHSLHAYFMRAGRPDVPVRFVVEPLRDGRSFGTRRVDAVQDGEVIATTLISFHRPESGPQHQDRMPARPYPAEPVDRGPFAAAPGLPGRIGAMELRPCRLDDGDDQASSSVWMRIGGPLPDDPHLHRALLIFLSDMTLLYGAFRAHGLARREVRTASIDHSLWLHRPGRVDEWVLYDSRSPSTGQGRAMGQGRLFSAAGDLLAGAAQEMSVRASRRGGAGPDPRA